VAIPSLSLFVVVVVKKSVFEKWERIIDFAMILRGVDQQQQTT